MVDEDAAGLRRAAHGERFGSCDVCGRLVAEPVMIQREGAAGRAEPVETLAVCADCRDGIIQGEVSFDAEIETGLQAADD